MSSQLGISQRERECERKRVCSQQGFPLIPEREEESMLSTGSFSNPRGRWSERGRQYALNRGFFPAPEREEESKLSTGYSPSLYLNIPLHLIPVLYCYFYISIYIFSNYNTSSILDTPLLFLFLRERERKSKKERE